MAAVCGIDDDILPTAALAGALATLKEVQRRDGLEDEMAENAPRVKLTRCSRKKRDMSMCVSLKASLTPRAIRRSSFEPTPAHPTLFSWSYSSSQATLPYTKRAPEKAPKLYIRSDGQ